jgi:hypothetical protein
MRVLRSGFEVSREEVTMRAIGCLIAAAGFIGIPISIAATYLPLMGSANAPSGFWYWPIVVPILAVLVGVSMYAFDLMRRESNAGASKCDRRDENEKKCPGCGTKNPIEQEHCAACGRSLQ